MRASLFLIPVTLGDTEHRRVLPEYNRDVILSIRHFIVENVRTARRFLKKVEPGIVIDDLTFYELNKHTSPEQVAGYLAPLAKGESVGVISEAGCPAIADPGADVVAIAQRTDYRALTDRVSLFTVICRLMLPSERTRSRNWREEFIPSIRRNCLSRLLTGIINWPRS